MLDGIPLLHYFKSKNQYSGSHNGMRYLFSPEKRTIADPDTQEEKEISVLAVTIWPEPWGLESTDPALRRTVDFPLSEDGIRQAQYALAEAYEMNLDFWSNRPGILDCEPWTPQEEPAQ